MSKERDLLIKVLTFLETDVENDFGFGSDIKELLAQPKQELLNVQDLKAKLFEHIKHGDEEHQRWLLNAIDNFFPLYTAQPAPDPLSDEEIKKLWTNQAPQNEFECVRLVEKAHGIGV